MRALAVEVLKAGATGRTPVPAAVLLPGRATRGELVARPAADVGRLFSEPGVGVVGFAADDGALTVVLLGTEEPVTGLTPDAAAAAAAFFFRNSSSWRSENIEKTRRMMHGYLKCLAEAQF